MSPYEILGVSADAELDSINAAYRRHAREHHPDAGGDASAFAQLQSAVELLRDPARRERYDETGETEDQTDGNGAAIATLIDAFNKIIASAAEAFHQVDIIGATDAHLAQMLVEIRKAGEEASLKGKRIENAINRLQYGGEGLDVIRGELLSQARDAENVPIQIAQHEATVTAARELLKGYRWKVDPLPAPPTSPLTSAQSLDEVTPEQRSQLFGASGIFDDK